MASQASQTRPPAAVPPEDLPLTPAEPTPSERLRNAVIAFLVRQGCDQPSPLTAWLCQRESAYYDGPGRRWDCNLFAYAAARDCACWQLGNTEAALADLLIENPDL